MSSDLKPEWRTEQTIASYDVDPHRRVRLPALCRFMQEAAYHHAEHLGLGHSFLADRGMAWVLARQRIKIDRLPAWGETVYIRTWPSGRDRLFFYRDFELVDGEGDRVLVASNAWSLIDIEKRARAHPDLYLSVELPEGERVFDAKLARLKGDVSTAGQSIQVTYGDLDLNGHVNNVRYIEWILNTLPLGFHEMHALRELEINFFAEAVYGQTLEVCSAEQQPLRFAHTVSDAGTALVRAVSSWKA